MLGIFLTFSYKKPVIECCYYSDRVSILVEVDETTYEIKLVSIVLTDAFVVVVVVLV